MKAIELQRPGLDGIAHVDRAPQGLGSGEIRVRIRAAAINYRDLFIAQGHYPIEYPRIPFSDAAGEVIDVAPDVSRVSVGDRVCPIFFPDWLGGPFDSRQFGRDLGGAIDGVLADEFVTSAEAVVRVPGHLSDVEASTLPCAALTAWSALTEHVTVRPGYRVVIEGTGGVSIAALQFAKMMGAEILLLSSSDEKLEQGRALGAHHLINYRKTPEWGEAAREIFDGRGADVVVDVGGAETFQQAVDALTSGGHISQVGLLSGTSATMPIVTFMTKGAHVHGISVGSRIAFEEMNRAIALHEWRPVINRTFAFDQAREAIDHFARGCLGKTVIEID